MSNDVLAGRIRPLLSKRNGYSERNMFGGVCFMINGNMCVGTWKDSLIVRLEREKHDETLGEPHTRPADIAGRTMKGWALVEPPGIASEQGLKDWVDRAAAYAASLPAK
ncbi:MAG: TfoX/Sxy family protein [Gemmatimonadetes bacterium]|nr:TfoX/Sxy family protein [Gemmatimonadota bacterium]